MKLSQNPFSLYDFLGYLVPGMFLILFYINLSAYDSSLGLEQFLNSQPISELQNYVGFVVASYLLGHALAILSSYSIERYALWKYGYPS